MPILPVQNVCLIVNGTLHVDFFFPSTGRYIPPHLRNKDAPKNGEFDLTLWPSRSQSTVKASTAGEALIFIGLYWMYIQSFLVRFLNEASDVCRNILWRHHPKKSLEQNPPIWITWVICPFFFFKNVINFIYCSQFSFQTTVYANLQRWTFQNKTDRSAS